MIAPTAQDVAVIIVNYNAGKYLLSCLAALCAQSEVPGEIIVVDNASEDGSSDEARAKFDQIQFIDAGSNIGFAAANNLGIRATEKPWVALVNPDAFVDPNWLQQLIIASQDHPEITFFSTQLVNAEDHTKLDGQGDCYHVSGLVWRRKHAQSVQSPASKLPLFTPCAAAAMYQRAAVIEAGGFDEAYFCYIEDVDLGFRLRLRGYDCLHVDKAICYHVGSAVTGRESDFAIYHGHRNIVWTYFKNMPSKLLWRYLPQHILMNLASIAYYVGKGRPGIIFRAKWHAIKGLPAILRQRVGKQPGANTIRYHMASGWLQPYFHRDA